MQGATNEHTGGLRVRSNAAAGQKPRSQALRGFWMVSNLIKFLRFSIWEVFNGDWRYYAWMSFLALVALAGLNAYCVQFVHGLGTTGMTDQVSWGLYIANFTFLVGMAAAAVMMVIPVYIYRDDHMHDVVVFGELLAIAALIMALLFVTVDLGRPERVWHMFPPPFGAFNWPDSMLSWDVIVLNGYLVLNAYVSGYLLYMRYLGRKPIRLLFVPFVFISIVWAVSIHSVTAFLYQGLSGRPFWHSSIIAPRFLASAFTAGPAFLILTLQLVRRFTAYKILDGAVLRLRDIVQVAMAINLFLFFSEVFKEFYMETQHVAHIKYLLFGLHGHHGLVPWIWTALGMNITAFLLLVLPATRALKWLNLACALAIIGVWIEKGMGFIVPAFIPTPLGEIVEYLPTRNEVLICAGIWALGFFIYTAILKVAIPILTGRMRADDIQYPDETAAAPGAGIQNPSFGGGFQARPAQWGDTGAGKH